jgi:hypothetical protein
VYVPLVLKEERGKCRPSPTQKCCVGISIVLAQQGCVGRKCRHLAVGPTRCRHVRNIPSQGHGGDAAKSVCSLSRGGGSLQLTMDCFLFFTSTVQFTEQPSVCPLHYSGAQEPFQPIDALPPPLLFHIFAKVSMGGVGLCAWDMQHCGRGDTTARSSPNHHPPDTKKGALPSAEPWEMPLQRSVSPFSGGEVLTAQDGLACFILFNYHFSLLK